MAGPQDSNDPDPAAAFPLLLRKIMEVEHGQGN